jgi:hypothetical protein
LNLELLETPGHRITALDSWDPNLQEKPAQSRESGKIQYLAQPNHRANQRLRILHGNSRREGERPLIEQS